MTMIANGKMMTSEANVHVPVVFRYFQDYTSPHLFYCYSVWSGNILIHDVTKNGGWAMWMRDGNVAKSAGIDALMLMAGAREITSSRLLSILVHLKIVQPFQGPPSVERFMK